MNAFGDALNLGFMRWSWWFSSGSMPMKWISDCIPMSSSSYSQANESLDAWVQVPISLPMNLWMLEFKSLFPANGLNLRLHSHESLFLSQWISDCIPMSSSPYSQANGLNLRLHSHEFLSPCQILESFGWVPPMSCHPDSGMSIGGQKNRILARFEGCPYTYHMGTPKIA